MEILNCGKIEVKPTSYSLIINADDEHGTLDLRLKINRQSLNKFASVMPLLIPVNRRMFERLSFWLDVPVEISYYSKTDTVDLSGKQAKFKVDGDEMTCWVVGYPRAIKITVIEFIQMINDLYQTIHGRFVDLLPTMLTTGESKEGVKTFRVGGVKVPNNFAPCIMATWDDELCAISHYTYTPDNKLYRRAMTPFTKFFRLDGEGCWTMTESVPFLNRTLLEACESFKTY